MTTKAFSILLLTTLVLGVALGGAFAGGYALGKSGEAAQPPESQSLRPLTGGQAAGQGAGRARAGQAQNENGDVAIPRSGAAPEQGETVDSSAGRPAGPQGAGGSAGAAGGSASEGQDEGRVQGLFGTISSLQGNLVTLESPRGQAQATISDTTAIQKRVISSVEDLSVGATVQVTGRPGEDGQIQARSVTLAPSGDGAASSTLGDAGRGGPGGVVSLLGPVESIEEGVVTIAGSQGTITSVCPGPCDHVLEVGDGEPGRPGGRGGGADNRVGGSRRPSPSRRCHAGPRRSRPGHSPGVRGSKPGIPVDLH